MLPAITDGNQDEDDGLYPDPKDCPEELKQQISDMFFEQSKSPRQIRNETNVNLKTIEKIIRENTKHYKKSSLIIIKSSCPSEAARKIKDNYDNWQDLEYRADTQVSEIMELGPRKRYNSQPNFEVDWLEPSNAQVVPVDQQRSNISQPVSFNLICPENVERMRVSVGNDFYDIEPDVQVTFYRTNNPEPPRPALPTNEEPEADETYNQYLVRRAVEKRIKERRHELRLRTNQRKQLSAQKMNPPRTSEALYTRSLDRCVSRTNRNIDIEIGPQESSSRDRRSKSSSVEPRSIDSDDAPDFEPIDPKELNRRIARHAALLQHRSRIQNVSESNIDEALSDLSIENDKPTESPRKAKKDKESNRGSTASTSSATDKSTKRPLNKDTSTDTYPSSSTTDPEFSDSVPSSDGISVEESEQPSVVVAQRLRQQLHSRVRQHSESTSDGASTRTPRKMSRLIETSSSETLTASESSDESSDTKQKNLGGRPSVIQRRFSRSSDRTPTNQSTVEPAEIPASIVGNYESTSPGSVATRQRHSDLRCSFSELQIDANAGVVSTSTPEPSFFRSSSTVRKHSETDTDNSQSSSSKFESGKSPRKIRRIKLSDSGQPTTSTVVTESVEPPVITLDSSDPDSPQNPTTEEPSLVRQSSAREEIASRPPDRAPETSSVVEPDEIITITISSDDSSNGEN